MQSSIGDRTFVTSRNSQFDVCSTTPILCCVIRCDIGHFVIPSSNFDKPLILSIDDDEVQLQLRRSILEGNGFSVVNADTGEEALNLLRENPGVSLVLSDHMLGGTTGTQLASELKQIKPNVPVVLYSGAPPPTMLNVDCFINKTEPIPEFLAIIGDLILRSQRGNGFAPARHSLQRGR